MATDARSGKVLISTGKEGYGATRDLIAGGMTESLGKSGQYEAFRDAVLKSIPDDELTASVNKYKGIYGNNPALIEREVVNEWVSNNLYNSPAIKQIVSADPQLANGVRDYLGGLKMKLGGMDGMQAVEREVEQAGGMWERAGNSVDFFVSPKGTTMPSIYKSWMGKNQRLNILNKITNVKLANAVGKLFRETSIIGNGGTADAIRFELETGILLSKSGHFQKGRGMIKYLERIRAENQLTSEELNIVNVLIEDLKDALGVK